MSYHKKIERQLVQDFSPEEIAVIYEANDIAFHGRRLQALEVGRLFGQLKRAIVAGVKRLWRPSRRAGMAPLNDHLRQDVGLGPAGPDMDMTMSRGYY